MARSDRRIGGDGAWLLALAALGCGDKPAALPPPDPDAARATLVRALDAWKAGRPAGELARETPALIAADHDWQRGRKLKGYRIADRHEGFGADRRFQVELDLDPPGKNHKKSVAIYSVATGTPHTVHRGDD